MSEAEQSQLWKRALQRQDDCPDPEELHALLDDSSPDPDSPLRKHARGCLTCSAELDLMRKVTASEADAQEEEAVEWMVGKLRQRSSEIFPQAPAVVEEPSKKKVQAAAGFSFWDWLLSAPGVTALASALLVVAILGGIWLNRGETGLIPPQGPPVVRSGRIVQLVPSGDLAQPPERFSWQTVEGASKYQVQVFEVDQSELWAGASSGSSLRLPRSLQEKILPGKRLLWQVTAFDEEGRQLASSAQASFRVEIEDSQ